MPSSLNFRKSSYSPNESACVEVADTPRCSVVRDTEHRDAGSLAFPLIEWAATIQAACKEA
ncbi:DUF397 domain-containing protein [Nocardiopsis algeriensis]|uniref:DUF397 domain-containing protein n=1 Tax=Nocardiopsis algeriensis TaxID=1478215 RepID=UPI003B433892